jgi:GMP synthase (glutamine-hydrolysing)
MNAPFRFLVAESETPQARRQRRESAGQSSGETYVDTLVSLAPGARCDRVQLADCGASWPDTDGLAGYDAVFFTGSPLHLYQDTPEVRRVLDFMRAVFASGTPAFGSCAGLQVATVAAGGAVRPNARGREAAFARRITPTPDGQAHPLLRGRPGAYDALSIHTDEVETLPDGAVLLASNAMVDVQAAEIRVGDGVFWGVQYHPELSLAEIAEALRREKDALIEEGFAAAPEALEAHVALIDALHRNPARRDLAWRLGLNEQVTDAGLRQTELRNFIEHAVKPRRAVRERA